MSSVGSTHGSRKSGKSAISNLARFIKIEGLLTVQMLTSIQRWRQKRFRLFIQLSRNVMFSYFKILKWQSIFEQIYELLANLIRVKCYHASKIISADRYLHRQRCHLPVVMVLRPSTPANIIDILMGHFYTQTRPLDVITNGINPEQLTMQANDESLTSIILRKINAQS